MPRGSRIASPFRGLAARVARSRFGRWLRAEAGRIWQRVQPPVSRACQRAWHPLVAIWRRAREPVGRGWRRVRGPVVAIWRRVRGPVGRAWQQVRAPVGRGWRRVRPVLVSRPSRFTVRWLLVLVVTCIGMTGGLMLGGQTSADIGPFRAELALTPDLAGGTRVDIPPLGALILDSHDGPLRLTIDLGSLDRERTEALVNNPATIQKAGEHALTDLENGLTKLVVQAGIATLLGGLALNMLVFRRLRRTAIAGAMSLVVLAATISWTAGTFRPNSVEEPRYEGLLTMAPAVVGDARSIVNGYRKYSKELQQLVDNVSKVYTTVSTLPVYAPDANTTTVLHISDMHLNPAAWDVVQTVVKQYKIDVVVDTGDIVDWGSQQEDAYVANVGKIKVPYVYVRGNHDSTATAESVRRQGAIVLEDQVATVKGITFAGIGDPRFTPDKQIQPAKPGLPENPDPVVTGAGQNLAYLISSYDQAHPTAKVDVGLVHDPLTANPLDGSVPLVLAGHLHRREVRPLSRQPDLSKQTLLMVQGSTGGAGLRGLESKTPTPLELSVLYFDPHHQLKAYDDISVGGTGRSEVTLQRHIIGPPGGVSPSASTSATGTPVPVPTG